MTVRGRRPTKRSGLREEKEKGVGWVPEEWKGCTCAGTRKRFEGVQEEWKGLSEHRSKGNWKDTSGRKRDCYEKKK